MKLLMGMNHIFHLIGVTLESKQSVVEDKTPGKEVETLEKLNFQSPKEKYQQLTGYFKVLLKLEEEINRQKGSDGIMSYKSLDITLCYSTSKAQEVVDDKVIFLETIVQPPRLKTHQINIIQLCGQTNHV